MFGRENILTVIFAGLCLAVIGAVVLTIRRPGPTVADIKAAMTQRDFEEAIRLGSELCRHQPGHVQAVLLGAEAASRAGRRQKAIEFLELLPARFENPETYSGWLTKAELQIETGRVSEAVDSLRAVLAARPDDTGTRRRLAGLLAGCGLRFEAVRLFRENLMRQDADVPDLVGLARNGQLLFSRLKLQRLNQLQPGDPLPVLGLITSGRMFRDHVNTSELMEISDAAHPALRRAYLRNSLLQSSSAAADSSLFQRYLSEILSQSELAPADWTLLASACAAANDRLLAARCLVQAAKADPWNAETIHTLSEMIRLSQPDESRQLLQLWQKLTAVHELALSLLADPKDVSGLQRMSALLSEVGRTREATEWARVALRQDATLEWARQQLKSAQNSVHGNGVTGDQIHPARRLPADLLEPPDRRSVGDVLKRPVSPEAARSAFAFEDVTQTARLTFLYDNGSDPDQEGLKMHQWTGGGVGVLDADGDAFPDLYFSQGGTLSDNELSDQLFRNVRGLHFANTTEVSGIHETGFGQGVAAGDVNNDGFDDIYVAAVGANSLLMNQGDGTFLPLAIPNAGVWTTSAAIADLNSDGLADLYDTNYARGEGVFEKTCDHGGRQRACGPTDFPAEPDRILISDGRGGFRDESAWIADFTDDARGMGLVVGDFDTDGDVEIYVANDESANQIFHVDGTATTESGTLTGVAYDQTGQRLGSMGIGIADIDNNGFADLFVTNYYSESNTLYEQIRPGAYVDSTASARLASVGFAMLGFGCQFADFDCDGDSDLIVANGHVDDFTHLDHPWAMRPQLFENNGTGVFSEVLFDDGYFTMDQLGRAVAVLDWNIDGRPDFVVTNVAGPTRLLQNSARAVRETLSVEPVGTHSARSAVGAVVRVQAGRSVRSGWLTAGDGYQCSSEKTVRFAVSAETPVLSVQWPRKRELSPTAVRSARLKVVEGRVGFFSIP